MGGTYCHSLAAVVMRQHRLGLNPTHTIIDGVVEIVDRVLAVDTVAGERSGRPLDPSKEEGVDG